MASGAHAIAAECPMPSDSIAGNTTLEYSAKNNMPLAATESPEAAVDLDADAAAAEHPISSTIPKSSSTADLLDIVPPAPIEAPEVSTSAASRVFNLPELLENILLHVPCVEDNARVRESLDAKSDAYEFDGRFPDPSKDLFILQRVNSSFKDTIHRNQVLQQRMFLSSHPQGPVNINPQNTIRWFVEEVGIMYKERRLFMWSDKQSITIGPPSYKPSDEGVWDMTEEGEGEELIVPPAAGSIVNFTSERWVTMLRCEGWVETAPTPDPEPSWRKMKVHCTKDSTPITVQYSHEDRDGSRGHTIKLAEFQYGDDMTLGKLHEGLEKLLPFIFDYADRPPDGRDSYWWSLDHLENECTQPDIWS